MGYMQGVTKKGIDLVSKVTGLLNQLTAEDFEDTYVGLRVSITDEYEPHKELGFWSNEYGYGNWAYIDGQRDEISKPKAVTLTEVRDRIASATPPHDKAYDSDIDQMAERVMDLLKEKRILP